MQVMIETAEDILHLRELDQKLWTVLSMPTKGIFFDAETAEVLDTDKDGFIRPPEILEAVDFLDASLKDISLIMTDGDSVGTADIKDESLLSSATWLLEKLGGGKEAISVEDLSNEQKIFDEKELLGFSDDDTDDLRLKKVISAFVKESPESDSVEILENIRGEKNRYLQWSKDLHSLTNGLELEQMLKAVKAFDDVAEKIDDYFIRCNLLKYNANSYEALTDYSASMLELKKTKLSTDNAELRGFPLATPSTEKLLPLKEKINPAWFSQIQAFYADVVLPFCGELFTVNEDDWKNIKAKILDFKNFYTSEKDSLISKLDSNQLENFDEKAIQDEIEQCMIFEKEKGNIKSLKKLLLLRRDFFTLLKNYISFVDFYNGNGSLFQAGVIFFDTKEAHLCFELNDDVRHATLDNFSGAYLLYCDIFRAEKKRQVLCLLTNGACDNVIVGQNAVFYDREGRDWNATVTKISANPISIKEAFFTPYKNLVRLIEEQVAKRTSDAEAKSSELISTAAEKTANVDKIDKVETVAPKKLDLGTIALIGTAIGGISTLVGSILGILFGLGFWVPVGLAGLLLLISGPSMILAAMKLRKRSIAPILEANGWAINAHTRVNIALGTSLTKLSKLPRNSKLTRFDPFAEKKKGKYIFIFIVILLLLVVGVFCYFYFIKKAGLNPLKWGWFK